jgi:predicted transcriptional regulator
MKYVYIVQEISCTEDDIVGGVIKGVYTTIPLAQAAIKEFRRDSKKKNENVLYDLVMKRLDYMPMTSRDMEKAIEELIQKDLMEALVGEDGLFYYELTEKGKKYAEKLRGGSWPFNLLDHDEGGELGSTDGENDDCDE